MKNTILRDRNRNTRRRAGFSLAEVLVVVVILLALLLIGIPSSTNMMQSSRQATVDRGAEQLYSALARNMKSIEVSGNQQMLINLTESCGNSLSAERIAADAPSFTRSGGVLSPLSFAQSGGVSLLRLAAASDDVTSALIDRTLYYIDSNGANSPSLSGIFHMLIPDGSVSDELLSGDWVVVYNPGVNPEGKANGEGKVIYQSPAIIAVYVASEDAAGHFAGYDSLLEMVRNVSAENLNSHSWRRMNTDGYVGYYGGGAGSTTELTVAEPEELEQPVVWLDTPVNGEELTVTAHCRLPRGYDASDVYGGSYTVTLLLKVESMDGSAWVTLPYTAVDDYDIDADSVNECSYTFVLDSLKNAENGTSRQFKNLGTRAGAAAEGALTPGEDVRLSVSAVVSISDSTTDDDLIAIPVEEIAETTVVLPGDAAASAHVVNSLFEQCNSWTDKGVGESGSIARVACGRHLQNLDEKLSLVSLPNLQAVQTADIGFGEGSGWNDVYSGATFLPIVNSKLDSYDGGAHSIGNLRVTYADMTDAASAVSGHDNSGAGLFGVFSGTSLHAVYLSDPVIGGAAYAGGLAGRSTGSLSVADCRLYMPELREHVSGARDAEWLTAATAAGGLIGSASGELGISGSFAATVIRSATVGGLVGSAANVAVKSSYADCYLRPAATAGGLVGSASRAGFDACYSAGFLIGGASAAAAGFVYSTSATISNSYSIFCFDDATVRADNGLPAPGTGTFYALAAGGTAVNAYYTYAANNTLDGAVQVDGSALEGKSIPGLINGNITANTYGLAADRSWLSDGYFYPHLSLPHYNDFYVTLADPIKLYHAVLSGSDSKLYSFAVSDTPDGQSRASTSLNASVRPRLFYNQVFVGWFTLDQLEVLRSGANVQSTRAQWAAKVDGLEIDIDHYCYTEADGRLASLNALPYNQSSQLVTLTEEQLETAKKEQSEGGGLYALYREAENFNVTVMLSLFDADMVVGGNRYLELANAYAAAPAANRPAAAQELLTLYTRKGSISNPLIYEINPIAEARKATRTGLANLSLEDNTTYSIIGENDSHKNVPRVFCFYTEDDKLIAEAVNDSDLTAEGYGGSLVYQTDRERTYVILWDSHVVEFYVNVVFEDSKQGESDKNTYVIKTGQQTLAERLALLQKNLPGVTQYAENQTYTAYVQMRAPVGVTIYTDFAPESIRFDGFELDMMRTPNTIVRDYEKDPDYPVPSIYYRRLTYSITYDLDSGVYTPANSDVTSSAKPSDDNVPYNRAIAEYLPKADTDENISWPGGRIARKGYVLDGWTFYAETDANQETPLNKDGLKTIGSDLDTSSLYMPYYNVIAKPVWKKVTQAPVRVEIYVQNVTDPVYADAPASTKRAEDETQKTYSFYNAYTVTSVKYGTGRNATFDSPTISDFTNLSDANLLIKAYGYAQYLDSTAGSRTGNGSIDIEIGNATREYLRNAYSGSVDGSVLNKQLTFNAAESKYGEDYVLDPATGQAVFKLYYDRETITFNYKGWTPAPKANGLLPTTTFKMYELSLAGSGGNAHYECTIDGIRRTVRVYYYIDSGAEAGVKGQYYKNTSSYYSDVSYIPVITIGDKKYIFADDVTNSINSSNYYYFMAFYNKEEISAYSRSSSGYTLNAECGIGRMSDGVDDVTQFVGLYESDLPRAWPGGGTYGWKVKNDNSGISYSQFLSYLSSYYYDTWIEDSNESGRASKSLTFIGYEQAGSKSIYFYTEKATDTKSGRGKALRTVVDNASSMTSVSDAALNSAANGAISADLFTDLSFTFHTASGGFILNDKIDGYEVKAVMSDTTTTSTQINSGYKSIQANKFTAAASDDGIWFTTDLSVYNARVWRYVLFDSGGTKAKDAYFYETTLDRLPNVTDANKGGYLPGDLGSEFLFRGWYTANNGDGHRLMTTKLVDGVRVESTETDTSEKWLVGDVYEVIGYEDDGKPRFADEPYTMPSANVTFFAYWSPNQLTLESYALIPGKAWDAAGAKATLMAEPLQKLSAANWAKLDALISSNAVREADGKYYVTYVDPELGSTQRYRFDGWYKYRGEKTAQNLTHDDLTAPLGTNETLVVNLTLAARWTLLSGKAPYRVHVTLLDEDGHIDGNKPDFTFVADEYVSIGIPYTANAPTESTAFNTNGMDAAAIAALQERIDDLANFYPVTPVYSTENFAEDWVAEFTYRPGNPWTYTVECYLQLPSDNVLIKRTERTSSYVTFYPEAETIAGLTLVDTGERPSVTQNLVTTARFYYTLDGGVFSLGSGSLTLGEALPDLLTVNVDAGSLKSLDGDMPIRTTLTYKRTSDNYTVTETREGTARTGEPALDQALKPGAYTVTAEAAYYKNGAKAGAIWSGSGGALTVSSEITLRFKETSDDFVFLWDGTALLPADAEKDLAALLAKAEALRPTDDDYDPEHETDEHPSAKKPFRGFWSDSSQVLGSDASVIEAQKSTLDASVTLTARYGVDPVVLSAANTPHNELA